MIEVRALSKFYGTRRAIEDLSFSVGKGEILGFLGPNGAGKSTTMKIITCFMPATSGVVRVAGYDVFEQALEVKKRVGYLPETPPVYRDMIVLDYLVFAARLRGVPSKLANKAANEAIEKCGLGGVRNRLIGNLSKGFRQRVGLAQAIVHKPEVLVLDEPTVGLDPKQIIEIRELIRNFAGEHTVILSTHILPEVQATCSRVLIINQGKIVAIDSLAAISARLRKSNVLHLIVEKSSEELKQNLRSVPGVLSVVSGDPVDRGSSLLITTSDSSDVRLEVSKAVFSTACGLLELKREGMSLEDVFVKLTTVEHQT